MENTTHKKMPNTMKGIRKISVNETSLRIFLDWNSTREMRRRAPHQTFWPSNCKKKNRKNI